MIDQNRDGIIDEDDLAAIYQQIGWLRIEFKRSIVSIIVDGP